MFNRAYRRAAQRRMGALNRAVSFSIEELELRRLLSVATAGLSSPASTHRTILPAGNITLYVDQNATGANTGADWADAYTDLQTALSAAGADSPSSFNTVTINVAQGTYSPGSAASNTFDLRDDVTLVGGFPTGGASSANPTQYPTLLSGSNVNNTVVTSTANDSSAVLNGFTIENVESTSTADGGALYVPSGSPTIDNCDFFEDYAQEGGAVYNDGSPTFNNCTFSADASGYFYTTDGGSMYNGLSASPVLNNCSFTNNDEAIDAGGAIADFSAASITLNNCTIDDTFSGDSSQGDPGDGSAIYVQSTGTLTASDCTFNHNLNNGNGGAVDLSSSGTASFTNCIFTDNSGGGNSPGGALYTSSTGALTLAGCVFTDNTSGFGQAVYVAAGSPSLINCSFSDNGSAFYEETGAAFDDAGGSPTLTNCILYGDTAEITGGPTVSYSDIEGDFNGASNINANPMFSTSDGGILELTQFSPCINAGNSAAVPGSLTVDAAGNPRITGGVVDMGAYEFQAANSSPQFVNAPSAGFALNANNSFTLSANAFPPATFSETGTLPPGVTLTNIGGSQATLSGTPTGENVYNITLTASNGISPDAMQQFVLTVGTPPAFTSNNNFAFNNGQSGSFTVATTGTPLAALSESGSLPAGITFTNNGDGTATISGTPPAGPGILDTLILKADNGIAPPATQTFTLTVNGPPTVTSTNGFSVAADGNFDNLTITTAGPTPTITETGNLPSDLTFTDNGDGTASISGYPTASDLGAYDLTIQAANAFGTAAQAVTLTVSPTIIYVDQTATGDDDGQDWADAFTDLNSALNSTDASTDQAVQFDVAAGTYIPTVDFNYTYQLPSFGSLQLVGGFADGGSTSPDPSANVTSLFGNSTSKNIIVNDAFLATIGGFTITGGDASNSEGQQSSGAGIYNQQGDLTVDNCTFSDNQANASGGAIYNNNASGTLTVNNSEFVSNSAINFDGGAIVSNSTVDLTNCVFLQNSAGQGGAVFSSDSVSLINCVFGGNTATSNGGGALFVNSPQPDPATLLNCTFTDNTAADAGGAIYSLGQGPVITNCILFGDGAPEDAEIYNVSGPNVMFSDVEQGSYSAANGNIDVDPMFVNPPDELSLQSASPCINTGSNAALPSSDTTDAAGNPRIAGGTVDMGAYEFPASGPITIYVDQSATGQNNGHDWTDAFTSLDTALDYAAGNISGTTPVNVLVAAGTYVPTSSSFQSPAIPNSVTLIGGYAPGGSTSPNPGQNVTTLSGGANVLNVMIDDSPSLSLSGFTLIGGNADGGGFPDNAGGGINVIAPNATLTVTDCTFTANQALAGGGAIYVTDASSTLIATDCEFTDNMSVGSANGVGGAINSMAATTTISNSTFSGNSAGFGGAISTQSENQGDLSTLILNNDTFANNTAADNGGAIDSAYGNVVLATDTFFTNNSAGSNGGAVYLFEAFGNYTSGEGFTNCVFTQNSSATSFAAALGVTSATPTILNCTFTDNTSATGGAAIEADTDSVLVIDNSIVYGDTPGEILADVSSTFVSFSDVQGGVSGSEGDLNANPMFVGAPSNVKLAAGSPVIDAGSPAAVPSTVTTDIAGNPRLVNGHVDMGAYEFVSSSAPQITSASSATFIVGAPGSFTVTSTGNPTLTLSPTSVLPSGVVFVDNGNGTATLSGTPAATTSGVYPLTIVAANGTTPNASQTFTLTINQAPAFTSAATFTTATGVVASFTVQTAGFPEAAISESGTLPTGFTFTDNGNGTATLAESTAAVTAGTFSFTLTASNGVAAAANQSFTLFVSAPKIHMTSGGVVSIVGTSSNESGSVSVSGNDLIISLDGQQKSFTISPHTSVNIVLGNGNDTLTISANVPAVSIVGGAGNNSINVASASATIMGGTGNDTIITSGRGSSVNSNTGNNDLVADAKLETVKGGRGRDTIDPLKGGDSLRGGAGTNFFLDAGAKHPDSINGGAGFSFAQYNPADTMKNIFEVIDPPAPAPSAAPAIASEPLVGGPADATVATASVAAGELKITGTSGDDTISVTINAGGTKLKVVADSVNIGTFSTAGLSAIRINGKGGDDSISVAPAISLPATLDGNGGNDTLVGGGGDNVLIGGGGNDSLVGGANTNLLVPDLFDTFTDAPSGNVTLDGGAGFSIADYSRRTDQLTLSNDGQPDSDTAGGHDSEIMSNVSAIWGGTAADTITGAVAGVFLSGGDGANSIHGGGANDLLVGGGGNDTVIVAAEPVSLYLLNGFPNEYGGVNDPSEDILQLDSMDTEIT
jgi:predicted outer membrane repeat protein